MAKRQNKILYNSQLFLNKPGFHSDASVMSKVEMHFRDYDAPCLDVDFRLRDCHNTVTLALETYSRAERGNTLFKIRALKKSIQGLERAYIKAMKELPVEVAKYEEEERLKKAKRKAKKSKKKK